MDEPHDDIDLVVMAEDHLDGVLEIERTSFGRPWRREHFLFEMRENRWAVNRVAIRAERVLGYACVWHLCGELKINNIAVHPAERQRGLASWILRRILNEAEKKGCRLARLEVRESNAAARRLYRRNGFEETGRREGYYQQDGEDAVLMEAPLI